MDEQYQQAVRHWTLAQPVVSAYVSSVVRDFRDRDDLLQEISVAVLESYASYDSGRPFTAWVIGIAKKQIGTYLRERKRNRFVFDADTVESLADAFEQIDSEETRKLDYLHQCVAKLEGRARQICELRYQNDLKPVAIAGLLGMTANSVAKSLQRIREQLRQCIDRLVSIDGAES